MVKRAISSISNQTVLPEEVIVIDDYSEPAIQLSSFSHFKNLNINVIRNNRNSRGGSYCRNLGIIKARTKYLTFLDDDDVFDIDYLEKVKSKIDSLEKSIENIAVYSSKKFVLSTSLEQVFRKTEVKHIVDKKTLLLGNEIGTTSCVTISKASLNRLEYFDENLPAFQDYDLWLRLTMFGVLFYPVSDAYILYTINTSSNQISGNYDNHISASLVMLSKYKVFLSKEEYDTLNDTLLFLVAKAIHRKKYLKSLKYTIKSLSKKIMLVKLALLIPYKILNKIGLYTS